MVPRTMYLASMILSAACILLVRGWGFTGSTQNDDLLTKRRFLVKRHKRILTTRIGAESPNENKHASGERLDTASLLKRIEELEKVVALGEAQRKKTDDAATTGAAVAAGIDLVAKKPAVSAAFLGTPPSPMVDSIAPSLRSLSTTGSEDMSTAATDTTASGDDALVIKKHYQVVAAVEWEGMAARLENQFPERFKFHRTKWDKFPDGTDDIEVGGFTPHNSMAGERVLFLANFHSNDVTLSQLQVMVMLLQSSIKELVVVLPFFPVGTMDDDTAAGKTGKVATADTYAHMFSHLLSSSSSSSSCGYPTRLLFYDLHTQKKRFHLQGTAVGSFKSSIPLLLPVMKAAGIDCVAFPDEGAARRFGGLFQHVEGIEILTCTKVRNGEQRTVSLVNGNPKGRTVVVVDDLVQTGGTLYECGRLLMEKGCLKVSAFAAHGVFPQGAWRRFAAGGDRSDLFETFWLTNSVTTTIALLPKGDAFKVLDLLPQIAHDLDDQ